jgi:hypothetical protein
MKRQAAVLTLLAGLGVIAVAQLVAPLGAPPLYDGVVVQDPYRYLAPGPTQFGSPASFTASPAITGSTSPQFVGATTESPPQAQLIAQPGAFVLPAGSTSLTVSIEPVAAPSPPSSGPIAGNVYRFMVVDQAGVAVAISPSARPTLLLRAPDGVADAVIYRFSDGAWHALPTEPSGQPGIAIANVSALGDFALIALPTPGVFGLDPTLLGVASVAGVLSAVVLGYLVWRNQRRPTAIRVASPRRRAVPSKRRSKGRRRGGSR